MKRRDLIQKVAKRAKEVGVSWGRVPGSSGAHEAWQCEGLRVPVPRHREINEYTAQGIMRDLETELGKDWWR